MLKKNVVLGLLALVVVLVGGCGNPVDSALNGIEAAAEKAEKAAKSDDQAGFLAGMGDAVNAMAQLKSAVEAVPADKRPEYAKKAQQVMTAWAGLAASSEFRAMVEKIAAGPDAPKLGEIMQQMKTTTQSAGTQF